MTVRAVIAARRRERAALVEGVRAFALGLDVSLRVQAVVVVGSVARGDFHAASDTDLLVVAEGLPVHPLRRADALGPVPPGVEVIAWTCEDWKHAANTGNPIWAEALSQGIWLVGSRELVGCS